jgi:Ca2+-binding RTX toxin-like protein
LEWLEQRTLLSADGLLPMATEASDDIPLAQAAVVENAAWFGAGHADAASAVLDGPGASDGDDLFGGAVPWMSDDAPAHETTRRGSAALAGDAGAGGAPGSGGDVIHLDGELTPAGGVLDLKPGDVLAGSGTIRGDVTGEGTIRPGNSPGRQTIAGDFTPGEATVTEIEIWGPGQGLSTGYDWVEVTGAASPNGTLKVLFQPQGGYVPALGHTFDILTWSSRPAGQVFDNWLGTASIPGQPGWALKPTYLADRLRLTLVQTPALAAGLDVVLLDGIQKLGDAANFLDGAGKFAQAIPFVGSNLGSLADSGTAIVNGLKNRLSSVLSLFPRASQVVSTIEGWHNTTFGGFTLGVNGVLANYGSLSTDPMWWDVNLELRPTAATFALQNVLGSVFGAAFNGAAPSVSVQASVGLDFSFGNDAGFFLGIDSLSARASVNATNLTGFQFGFSSSSGLPSFGVTNGSVSASVAVSATPDAGVLTGGRLRLANLTSLASGALPVGNAFNTTDSGSLHAAFPFGYQLVNFAGFSLAGQYVLHVDTDDLLGGSAPAVTLGVNSTLTLSGQTLSGSFTFKNTGTETILQASNVTFALGAGSSRVLSVQNGSGNLVLLGTGVAGTLTMDLALGPAVPGLTLSLTGLSLAVNTTGGPVASINGVAVNLPSGPYFRVSGNGNVGLSNPAASLSGDFVFEPRDADSNPGNGYEEVAVGVANVAFAFSEGAQTLVNVTQGSGVLVFRPSGLAGQMSAQASIAVPGFSLSGTHTVALNTSGSAYNSTVNVNGTSLALNLGAGPYLKVSSTGSTAGTTATLQVQGTVLRGNFEFERKTTASSQTVVTIAMSAASVDLGPSGGSLVRVTGGSGLLLLSGAGIAGDASATVTLAVPGVTASGTFRLRLNTRSSAVNETVTVGGSPVTVNVVAGPYVRVEASSATLSFLGINLSGNFSFEQRTSAASQTLVTVNASNVAFGFGSGMVSASNGSAFLVFSSGGVVGSGSVTVAVQAFGAGFSRTFDWSFNTLSSSASHQFNIGSTLREISLPGGPYFRLDSGPTPVGFDVSVGPLTVAMSGRLVLTLVDPRNPAIALSRHLSGGVNGVSAATATLNPFGDNNAVRVTTTNVATAGDYNDAIFRFVEDPTITGATATASWDLPSKVLTVRLNGTQTTAATVVSAINSASPSTPFTASLSAPDNGSAGNTGAGTMMWFAATVGVSGLDATLAAGPVTLGVTNGTGAFVLNEGGLAGDVRVGTATLTVPGLPSSNAIALTARSLAVRFNGTGTDVGNPDAVMVRVNEDPADDVPLQFKGAYYRQYFSISGGADLSILGGAVTLGGDFVFEKTQINVDANPGLEDVFKVGVSNLAFGLKAGTLEVLTFTHGSGGFFITPAGVAGSVDVQFGTGLLSLSGTVRLDVNTTGAAVSAVTVPLPSGNRVLNLSAATTLVVTVTNARIHLGSASFPFPSLKVSMVAGTVVVQSADGATTYVTIDSSGNITTGLSFSDFAAPGPFEFVSMLRQALVWMDAFSGSDLFQAEIPFTGGKTLGDALAWSQLFADEVYSMMATMELQSRSLALQTVNAGTGLPETRSGSIAGATFKLQLGSEAAVTVTISAAAVPYSNADNNLDELTAALNTALATAGLAARVVARIHKVRDQVPSDTDYAQRFRDDILVLALTESELAKGTTLMMTEADAAIEALGFADNQQAVLTHRYDTRGFFIQLGQILTGSPGTYDPARRVYTYDVNLGHTFSNQDLFGSPTLPFDWNLDLGPLADAQLSGALSISATVGLNLRLGFDLRAAEVPRILSTTTVPVPANGRISRDATFRLYINDATTGIDVTLDRARTLNNNSIEDLKNDLNDILATIDYTGPLVTSPTKLNQMVVFQKAGSGLALSALHEIDTDGNGVPDAGKDLNGDGNTDTWLDVINRLVVTTGMTDPFATELGFANETMHVGGTTYVYVSGGVSTPKGLFVENANLSGSVTVATPTPISGSVKFGFVELTTAGGVLGTLGYDGVTPAPLTASLALRNPTTGDSRLYLSDLMGGTSSDALSAMVPTPSFAGSILAKLDNLSVGGLGFSFPLGANPELSAWIPDINDLSYNSQPYNGSNTGIFLTYPDLGSLESFTNLSFTQIVRALNAVADNLATLSAFSFLDEPMPFINMSVNDLLDHAQRLAELFDAVAGNGSAESLQEAIDRLETEIERVFDLDPSVLTVWIDDGGLTGLVAGGGVNGSANASVTLTPNGNNNNFVLTSKAANLATASQLNGSRVRILGDASVADTTARASWDEQSKVLTVRINPGRTTASAIVSAINAAATPWNAALAPPDNAAGTNTGAGTIVTTALGFSLNYSVAYADSLPFQLSLDDLVQMLAGDSNAAVRSFLEAATTLVQIGGSGKLDVSASADITLSFGLDLTNPTTVRPFLYDTTGIELRARILGSNLEIEASLGSVFGIFIKNGSLVIDKDGDAATGPLSNPLNPANDRGAVFRLGLRNNNGDGRHYFDESFLNLDNIDLTLEGGVSARLPVFAPFEGTPLGGTTDANADGYPDNELALQVADIVRLFQSEEVNTRASGTGKVVRFSGYHNDLNVQSSLYSNYKILFLNAASGGTANANFNVATQTLTVNVDAGDTTGATARDAIKLVAGFASTALTSDDDGVAATTTNLGTGRLNKIVMAAPNFGSLFADLDLCTVISANIGTILDGLDELLGNIQDGLNALVFSTELPLIGPGLEGAANFIDDFRNGLLLSLRNEVNAAGGNGLTALENAIKKAFWNTLGPGGLDLLVNVEDGTDLDASQGFGQLDVTIDCDDGLVANLRLKKSLDLLDTTQNPIDFDIGVPGFGLQVDGNVRVSIGFDLKFGFGFNTEDGFYFDTTATGDAPELVIDFKAEIPGLKAKGELLFLQLEVMDDAASPTIFEGYFRVDLKDPDHDNKLTFAEIVSGGTQAGDIIDWVLGAEAHVNLDLIASFGGNAAFPKVLADFKLDWLADTNTGIGSPNIRFENIQLDMGSFLSDFLGPILSKIADVTKPLDPILDLVQARIPVLSDLAGEDITLLVLAERFGLLEPSTVQFINDVLKVLDLLNSIQGLGTGSILIPMGSFSLTPDSNGGAGTITPIGEVGSLSFETLATAIENSRGSGRGARGASFDDIARAIENSTGPGATSTQRSLTAGFTRNVGSLSNFKIPIFDNPSEIFQLFTGGSVRLVEWRMPTFNFKFTYTQKIPIYPPLYAQFGGEIGAKIDIGFGYDTYGIQKFIASEDKNWVDILDGFYVIDFDDSGHERPELTLSGKIFAGASINLLIAEAGVNGGIEAIFTFDLNDVNDDGKVRVSEIIANAQIDPRCIFDIHGKITLFLEAFLSVDLFFFSIDKTWRLADLVLLEFDITCPEPVLAEKIGTELFLNIGSRAANRLEIDTTDNSERFVVKHVGGDGTSETVDVQWGNWTQTYEGITKVIVQDAGNGDDYVDMRGVLVRSEFHGGVGNDTVYLSDGANSEASGDDGDDQIFASTASGATSVILHGGAGNDVFTPGIKAITIYGDNGNDVIVGTAEADHLYGDDGAGIVADGDDVIDGKDGDDVIRGGKGNDNLEGGPGNDWVRGDDGADLIRGSRGDDVLDGGGGDDKLYGGSGNDLLLGGAGADWANGHSGTDVLIGDHEPSLTIAGLAVTEANLAALRAAVGALTASGITVTGISGGASTLRGNDMLIGGGGSDGLFGGPGSDALYGGNFMNQGEASVVEEDGNDFIDGGPDNDVVFGDDSMGREGTRNTGISIDATVWMDVAGSGGTANSLRDEDESGFAGVVATLYRNSDGGLVATMTTDAAGLARFQGLDPNYYYLVFSLPAGLLAVTKNAGGAAAADAESNDSDISLVGGQWRTASFHVGFDEAETAVAAGFSGPARVSVSDQVVTEGSSGETQVTFVFTLSQPQQSPVEIEYRTLDLAGPFAALAASGDYVAISNTTLTFAPGETSKSVTVVVLGDLMYEPTEQFELDVVRCQRMDTAGPVALEISDTTILATITNDDVIPSVSISDFQQVPWDVDVNPATPDTVQESKTAEFVVTLSNPSQYVVTVGWRSDVSPEFLTASIPGAATPQGLPGADFALMTGTVTFQPGETSKLIQVTVYGDALDEVDESFVVDLYEPTYASISDSRGWGVIADDDAPVGVSIQPVVPAPLSPDATEVVEGNFGSKLVEFWITLSAVSGKEVVVRYNTAPGTALESVFSGGTDSVDYEAPLIAVKTEPAGSAEEEGTVRFAPGELTKKVNVRVWGDTQAEGQTNPDNPAVRMETFFVNLFAADGADIAPNPSPTQSNHVTVRIIDDDAPGGGPDQGPWAVTFTRSLWVVDEPKSGSVTVPVTLRRTPGSSNAVVVFATVGGTATAVADYTSIFRQLVVFGPTELERIVPVTILADSVVEGTERINLSLRNPTGGPVRGSPADAVIEIRDEDQPEIYFPYDPGSPVFTELSGGGVNTQSITVALRDPATDSPVLAPPGGIQVAYRIVPITARAPGDFGAAAMTGTLVFGSGVGTQTIPIDIIRDNIPELPETFAVALSNPVGATIAANEEFVVATIEDDDLTPLSGEVYYDSNGNGWRDFNEAGIKDVSVKVTYYGISGPVSQTVLTNSAGVYAASVLLGPVTVEVDGSSVTSPYQGVLALFLGSGDYESTTDNENQTIQFQGIGGLPAFKPVGYYSTLTFALPEESEETVGRGGTDDTLFGGPGNDTMSAGSGDDFVVGGHWMTATDNNTDVNRDAYAAPVTAVVTGIHAVHDSGPIYQINLTALPVGGTISGQVWEDLNANGKQDPGELFAGEVVVNLYDCEGNPVNSVVTTTGSYQFTRLPIHADGSPSEYVVEFVLPDGKTFVSPVPQLETMDSDVVVGGRTTMLILDSANPNATDVDAGIRGSSLPSAAITGGLRFAEPAYGVSEAVEGGKLWVTVVRGDSSKARAAVVRTVAGTALPGVHYQSMIAVLSFGVGEQEKLVALPIINSNTLGLCTDPKALTLELRDAGGRLYNTATVFIGGPSFGNLTDDDVIDAGGDWDMVLGDSGAIPASKTFANASSAIDPILLVGGLGNDVILGGDGPDWINGQLGKDDIAGGSGEDVILADMGNDVVRVDLDNDVIDGGHGTDTVVSTRDVPWIELATTGPSTAVLRHRDAEGAFPLGTFTLTRIEVARLYGGALDNTFDVRSWDGSAYLSGAGGRDTLRLLTSGNVVLKDASPVEGALFSLLYGYWKDAAALLTSGATYHMGSIEDVRLAGGAGANVLDASLYSRPVRFSGGGGNDTLIGGTGDDEFAFEAVAALGTDTVRGNGGRDTITLQGTLLDSTLNLALVGPASQVVNANLSLILLDAVENAVGGNGNDTLIGNDLDNVLSGGPGNDTLDGRAGNEVYAFDSDSAWGTETIIENPLNPGRDTLDFSATTTLSIQANLSVLNVAQVINANLTLILQGGGIEILVGGDRADVLRGDGLDNEIHGGPGDDLLDGKGGNDWLDGGAGNDDIIGGDGIDRIAEAGNTNFTLSNASLVRGTGETDALDGIEVAWLYGGISGNRFDLTGWTGSGRVVGDLGEDVLVWAADANFVLTDASVAMSLGSGPLLLFSIEEANLRGGEGANSIDARGFSGDTTLSGGLGHDVIRGGSGRDVIDGGPGNDVLSGGLGNDEIQGGTGTDTLDEDWSAEVDDIVFILSNTRLTISTDAAGDGVDVLSGLENVRLVGGTGNDLFDVSEWRVGPVRVEGGPGGTDMIRVQLAPSGISGSPGATATLTNAGIAFTGGTGAFDMVGIEAVTVVGTDWNDVIDASQFSGWASLDGGAGDDVLHAGPGVNWLFGGVGNDRFVFRMNGGAFDMDVVSGGGGVDQMDFSNFSVGITLDLSLVGVAQVVAAGEQGVALTALDVESVVGGTGNDVLIGNALDNGFTGGLGSDTIVGAGGVDVLVETGDASFTLTDVQLVRSGGGSDILSSIERVMLTGGAGANVLDATAYTGVAVLSGEGGNDTLLGGTGNDMLTGGAGDDVLRGGNGGDTYVYDLDNVAGSDVIDEVGGTGGGIDAISFAETSGVGVRLDLALTAIQVVSTGRLTLRLTDGLSVECAAGGAGDDILLGNAASNLLSGGLGMDQVDGRGGPNDYVREDRDADMTVVGTTASATLQIGAETDQLVGIEHVMLVGGNSGNVLDATAFAGSAWLDGMGGDDELYGGAGADLLQGGEGDDLLRGNGGDDALLGGKGQDVYFFDQSSPQGLDTVFELPAEGFADRLVGAGISGIDVDLFNNGIQVIGPNLSLQLWLAGSVEFSP